MSCSFVPFLHKNIKLFFLNVTLNALKKVDIVKNVHMSNEV